MALPTISFPFYLLLLLQLLPMATPFSFLSLLRPKFATPPPLPLLPIPSSSQFSWQLGETALFVHFGINTFNDSEWGSGHADPSIFNPVKLDAKQWVEVAAAGGFSRIILTTKHHDGFCLWPSAYTNYSVKSSNWKGGKGDVVKELSDAAREAGIGFGVYLSPWDRHEKTYGKTVEYNEYYMGQMKELLTGYGDIAEVWLDGAKGEGEKDMVYFFDRWFSVIRQLQPQAIIFSDAGPDVRWVGDEAGVSAQTCWSSFNRSLVTIGHTDDQYSRNGDPNGGDWAPPECDVSIRPGWFWHESEHPKSAHQLLDIYYKSVGRNCVLLLNVPPNSSGLISEEDVKVLYDFNKLRHAIFSYNLATNAIVTASSIRGGMKEAQYSPSEILQESIFTYWAPSPGQSHWVIHIELRQPCLFNVLQLQEPIHMGQRLKLYHLDVRRGGRWHTVVTGTTVGYKRLLRFRLVAAWRVRLVIHESKGDPLISFFGLYLDFISVASFRAEKTFSQNFNTSHIDHLTLRNITEHSATASF